jgi:hypothetical protein
MFSDDSDSRLFAVTHLATLKLPLFERPAAELRPLLGEHPPRWARRVYESYGAGAGDPPLSAAIEALGETLGRRLQVLALVLRRAEARGWSARLHGDGVQIVSGFAPEPTQEMLEQDGVWDLVASYLKADGSVVEV